MQPDELVDHDAHNRCLRGQFGQQEAAVLLAADRPAEGLALLGVLQRLGQHGFHRRGRHHRDVQPFLRQVLHQVDEAHALFAEQVLGGHFDVGERQLGGVLPVQTDLVELPSAFEALHVPLDDQQGEALRALVGIGLGHHDHQVGVDAVGDEGLGSVEHVVVALFDRPGLDALQVTAGARFGHGDRRDDFAGAELRQPALLLLVGGQLEQVRRDDVVVQAPADAAVPARRGLLGDDAVVAEVRVAAAAVLLGHVHAEEALLAGFQPDAAVDDLVLLPLRRGTARRAGPGTTGRTRGTDHARARRVCVRT